MFKPYFIINPDHYKSLVTPLIPKLEILDTNRVTYKNEIHKTSRFAICHYSLVYNGTSFDLQYDAEQSIITSNQKKTNSNPDSLNDPTIRKILMQFLIDINDKDICRAEVKLIQTQQFPFIFNPHRDSQFRRLRHITYLATVIVSADGIEGGNMQLFHSQNDKIGPFDMIEELPLAPGVGYVVDERPQLIYHGMKPAIQCTEHAHRAAVLIRFFNTPMGYHNNN